MTAMTWTDYSTMSEEECLRVEIEANKERDKELAQSAFDNAERLCVALEEMTRNPYDEDDLYIANGKLSVLAGQLKMLRDAQREHMGQITGLREYNEREHEPMELK